MEIRDIPEVEDFVQDELSKKRRLTSIKETISRICNNNTFRRIIKVKGYLIINENVFLDENLSIIRKPFKWRKLCGIMWGVMFSILLMVIFLLKIFPSFMPLVLILIVLNFICLLLFATADYCPSGYDTINESCSNYFYNEGYSDKDVQNIILNSIKQKFKNQKDKQRRENNMGIMDDLESNWHKYLIAAGIGYFLKDNAVVQKTVKKIRNEVNEFLEEEPKKNKRRE